MPSDVTTVKVQREVSETLGELCDEHDGISTKGEVVERLLSDSDLSTTGAHSRLNDIDGRVSENERRLELLREAVERLQTER